MSLNCTIVVDAMGGDLGPPVTVPSCLQCLAKYPQLNILLVGPLNQLEPYFFNLPEQITERVTLVAASALAEDIKPIASLKHKDSSLYKSLSLVAEGQAQACVSAGNTAAFMLLSRHLLRAIEGIDRLALSSYLPTLSGTTQVLDLGANLEAKPEHLVQFALMGKAKCIVDKQKSSPSIGLLNVGAEENKGNKYIQAAHKLLAQNSNLNYQGYVEGQDIFTGKVDVVLCNGLLGNTMLKSNEGLAQLVLAKLQQSCSKRLYRKIAAWLLKPIFKDIYSELRPNNYNGASLLGLTACLIKSHGAADVIGFSNALNRAVIETENNLPEKITDLLKQRR